MHAANRRKHQQREAMTMMKEQRTEARKLLEDRNSTSMPLAPAQKIDSTNEMNEMSEVTSLRLQMAMDRRSKFITTLSNIMKKISTTQDILVQNIK